MQNIKTMFGSIAKHYDITNDILSFGLHRLWKKSLVKACQLKGGECVLDLCTGTGDVAFALAKCEPKVAKIVGLDFSPSMVELAKTKNEDTLVQFWVGDATDTKLEAASFDVVTIAFGIRNIPDFTKVITEIKRVLKNDGRLAILEFGGTPKGIFGVLYKLYLRLVLPLVGWLIAGDIASYQYLRSSSLNYPHGETFIKMLEKEGFVEVKATPILFGVTWIYVCRSGFYSLITNH